MHKTQIHKTNCSNIFWHDANIIASIATQKDEKVLFCLFYFSPGFAKTVLGNYWKTKPFFYISTKEISKTPKPAKQTTTTETKEQIIQLLVSSVSNFGSWRCWGVTKQGINIISAFFCHMHKYCISVLASSCYFYISLLWLCEVKVKSWHRSASFCYSRFPLWQKKINGTRPSDSSVVLRCPTDSTQIHHYWAFGSDEPT